MSRGSDVDVWLGRGQNGRVVIKTRRSEAGKVRLARELRALQAIQHPNLVRLIDKDPGGSWIAVAHVAGVPMHEWARERTASDVAAAGAQVLEALRALHGAGVTHGDLKPKNVLVDKQGRVTVIDLDSSVFEGDKPSRFRGTPGYAAPERLRGGPTTPGSDVYGFGALMYTALTGRTPFPAEDIAALAYLPLVSLPEPPTSHCPRLPAALSGLVLTLLARDPTRRPTDLAKIALLLKKTAVAPVGPTIVGMTKVREALRKAVVGVADGESRIIALFGPPGCGRRTLLTEAVDTARREGLVPFHAGGDFEAAHKALGSSARPLVMALRATSNTMPFLRSLAEKAPCALVLVHADHPLLGISGSTSMSPPPLTLPETACLMGTLGEDGTKAEDCWRACFGHPLSIVSRCRGAISSGVEHLPAQSRRIFEALGAKGSMNVLDLAALLGMGRHEFLDHCEILFAEARVVADADGQTLRSISPEV